MDRAPVTISRRLLDGMGTRQKAPLFIETPGDDVVRVGDLRKNLQCSRFYFWHIPRGWCCVIFSKDSKSNHPNSAMKSEHGNDKCYAVNTMS